MYAYRKSNLTQFPCGSEDVCRIAEGSTNDFLTEPRIVEEYLRTVEPYYNSACDALSSGTFGIDDCLVIAGFAAFVIGCSPTAMRLGASSLTHLANTEVELLEAMGEIDPAPPELGSKTASELIRAGELVIETDHKFPQAMGISQFAALTKALASFRWEILKNLHFERTPFITSDFPAAIERPGPPAIRVVPLRPDLAIRIHPIVRPPHQEDSLADFRFRVLEPSPFEVRQLNSSIVQSAEEFVFASLLDEGLKKLVKKYAAIRLELVNSRFSTGTGYKIFNTVRPTMAGE